MNPGPSDCKAKRLAITLWGSPLDSGITLYLVKERPKPVLHGPNSTESRTLPSCFRARNPAEEADGGASERGRERE